MGVTARFWPMTEGSVYAHHDPSVSRITYTNGVMLKPPPLLRRGGKSKNTVQYGVFSRLEIRVWNGVLENQARVTKVHALET
jgi:hypothetical protein